MIVSAIFVGVVCFFKVGVSLYNNPDCPDTRFVSQADSKLRDLPAFASQLLELKVYTTTAQQI